MSGCAGCIQENVIEFPGCATPGFNPPLIWLDKSPGDDCPAGIDITKWLENCGAFSGIATDALASVGALVISPDDLAADLVSSSSTVIVWEFSGGTVGNTYTIGVTLTSGLGYTIQRNCYMNVEALSPLNTTNPPTQVVTGPPPTAAQIVAAFSTLPSFTAGAPPNGWWLSINGEPQQAPFGSLAKFTNGNLGTIMTAIGAI